MNHQKLFFVFLLTWLAGLTALTVYLSTQVINSNDPNNKPVTTAQFQTLASTLTAVQNNVAQTINSTIVTYDGTDIVTYIEAAGQLIFNGYLPNNISNPINITDVFNDVTCNCSSLPFGQVVLTNINSNSSVYISTDFTKYCQITYGSEVYQKCVDILYPCQQTNILVIRNPITAGLGGELRTVVKMTRSVGAACF